MDRAPVRRTPAPPEGHGSSWPTWRGAPLSFEGPGIVLFGSMSRTGLLAVAPLVVGGGTAVLTLEQRTHGVGWGR